MSVQVKKLDILERQNTVKSNIITVFRIYLGYPGDVLVGSEEFRQMQNHLERVINGNVVVGYDVFAQLRKLGLNKIRYMEMSSLGKREQKLLAENEAHSIMKFAVGI